MNTISKARTIMRTTGKPKKLLIIRKYKTTNPWLVCQSISPCWLDARTLRQGAIGWNGNVGWKHKMSETVINSASNWQKKYLSHRNTASISKQRYRFRKYTVNNCIHSAIKREIEVLRTWHERKWSTNGNAKIWQNKVGNAMPAMHDLRLTDLFMLTRKLKQQKETKIWQK